MIEIVQSGPANSVQDGGRHGLMHLGISRGGAMDKVSYRLANAALANPPDAAALEIAMFPFRARFRTDCAVALTGADCGATLAGRPVPPFWAAPVRAGDEIVLGLPRKGARAYLAVSGGILVDRVLGARSTDLKAGFGGFRGRGLAAGDRLEIGRNDADFLPPGGFGLARGGTVAEFWDDWHAPCAIRVLPASEFDDFGPVAQAAFFAAAWTVTRAVSRQGYRLDGPRLEPGTSRELLSHGLLPGVVQVPKGGLPIIQLAEANTCGGYPKIAGVIEADLWKIGQLGPGDTIRFRSTDPATAFAAGELLRV